MIQDGCLFWSIQGPVPDVGNKNSKMLFRMKWSVIGILFLNLSSPIRCFCPQTFCSNNVHTIYHGPPLYHINIYGTKNNQQECFRLSDWSPLRCFGLQINHFSPVWWSTMRFISFQWQLVCKFHTVERSFPLISSLYIFTQLCLSFSFPNVLL